MHPLSVPHVQVCRDDGDEDLGERELEYPLLAEALSRASKRARQLHNLPNIKHNHSNATLKTVIPPSHYVDMLMPPRYVDQKPLTTSTLTNPWTLATSIVIPVR